MSKNHHPPAVFCLSDVTVLLVFKKMHYSSEIISLFKFNPFATEITQFCKKHSEESQDVQLSDEHA